MTRAVFVIASKDFQDEEFFQPKEVLEQAKIEVVAASDQQGVARGSEGGEVLVKSTVEDLSSMKYEILVFVGGKGALKCLDNIQSYQVLRKANQEKKIIGAICIAPLILARAGILKNKKATVWTSSLYQKPARELEQLKAKYVNSLVVQDERIVTAKGPAAATLFGVKLVELYQHSLVG